MKNYHFFSIAYLIFALVFAIPQHVFAQTFPDKPSSKLVSDFAKIYSPQEDAAMEEKLVSYEKKTSTQIAVVTLNNLDGYPIDDYAIKLANKWGVGQKGKNNGLLILIAAADHKIHIASGYGMEGALNDGKLGTIIRTQIAPQFKIGNYYAGTNDGLDAIIAASGNEYMNDYSSSLLDSLSPKVLPLIFISIALILIGIAAYFILIKIFSYNSPIFHAGEKERKSFRLIDIGRRGFEDISRGFSLIFQGCGSGNIRFILQGCGNILKGIFTIFAVIIAVILIIVGFIFIISGHRSRRSGGSGSGDSGGRSGGFGGGSFGGGGAGGSW